MKKRSIILILAALMAAVVVLGVASCKNNGNGSETTSETEAPTDGEPTSAEPTSGEPDTTPVEPGTQPETSAPGTEPDTTPVEPGTEPAWSPEIIAWYDVDNGASGNARPDRGWYYLYPDTPGVTTVGGQYRSATPLLGTYDQGDIDVARQHLYWLGQAGFTALTVDATNVKSINDPDAGMRFYYRGVYDHTKTLFEAAKALCDEGVANVPRIYVALRMFGDDYAGLATVVSEYKELYEQYPDQAWHLPGSDKPFIAIFVDHAVYNTWGNRPKADAVDDYFDYRWTNGYLAGYGKDDGQGGMAIAEKRMLWLFVENQKGTKKGSYTPVYTVGADGSPEMMVASVSLHDGWCEDGSKWDALNHIIDGKNTLDRTLEPVYAYQPDVVIIDRFNYPLVWREEAQEGVGLYQSGHYEPCEELGFEMLYNVTRHAYAMRGLTAEGPAPVTGGTCGDGFLKPDMAVLPPEYRIGRTEDLSGEEWHMLSLADGIDYRLFTDTDTLYIQTRNAFGESEVTRITVEPIQSVAVPFTFEFEPYSSETKYAKYGNAWVHSENFVTWVPAGASGGASVYCSMHVDEKPNPDSAITTTFTVAAPGTYHLTLSYYTAPSSPIVRFYIDDQPIGEPVDCFSEAFDIRLADMGELTLTAGDHTLTMKSDETNSGRWEIFMDALFFDVADQKTEFHPYTYEFEAEGDQNRYRKYGNAWWDANSFTGFMPPETSGGASLYCNIHVDGDASSPAYLETEFTMPETGLYRVVLAAFRNHTSPVLRLYIDGRQLGGPIDLKNNGDLARFEKTLGLITLGAGTHTLRISADETNSGNWEVFADALFFIDPYAEYEDAPDPEPETEPVTDPETEPETEPAVEPIVFEFDPAGDQGKYRTSGNAWFSGDNFTSDLPSETSGGAALFCSIHVDDNASVDSCLETDFTLTEGGKFKVTLAAFRNCTSPVIQLYIDGQAIGGPIDLFHNANLTRFTQTLGEIGLSAGTHTVRIVGVGTQARWETWLDALYFEPTA